MRVQEGEAVLSPEDQTLYRCGVGILLYLVKQTRPDLANAVRELSRAMDVANYVHWKELMRVIKYALKTQEKGIVLKPEQNKAILSLKILVDAEFAGDKETRKSIMGRIIYLNETAIGWNSKGQGNVTLSTTEAEYVSMSEGTKDLLFVLMCLNYIKMKVKLPMVVLIDNIGAIEMLDSRTGQSRTKHIDTRYHWIKNYVDEGKLKVSYVKSENNTSDILTKNLHPKLFEKHANNLVTNVVNSMEKENDVGFYVRCNTRLIGKAHTWNDTDEAKEKKLQQLAQPMGYVRMFRDEYGYSVVEWNPNYERIFRLKDKAEGPLQLHPYDRRRDSAQKYVWRSSEKHIIKRYRRADGRVVNIYDKDNHRYLDSVFNTYTIDEDMEIMERVVQDKKIPKEKRTEALLKGIYGDQMCSEPWYRKPDPIYD